MQSEKWDRRFLELAEHVSSWSRDPSTKVAAVIVDDDRRVVSLGYNGLPKGVRDTEERYNNREIKLALTKHAEENAILFAQRSLKGCTIYTFPFLTCSRCAGLVIQSGIRRVVSLESDNPRWQASFDLAHEMFSEAGVEVVLYQ